MKAARTFRAVPPGKIYPVTVSKGDDIPAELEDIARELGCAPARKTSKSDASK